MPKHIKFFEWAWLGSLVIGIIISGLTYSATVEPGMEVYAAFIQFVVIGLILLLVLLTSRKRSNIAKWVLVVLFGLGVVAYIPELALLFDLGFAGVLSSLQLLAQSVGIYFLFTQESRDWFQG